MYSWMKGIAGLLVLFNTAEPLRAQRAEPTETINIDGVQPTDQSRIDDDPRDVLTDERWRRVDKSVERAIAWLASQQQSDGSFLTLEAGQPGVTSLVVLAFLAQGEMPGDGDYGKLLSRAIDYAIRCQKPNGLLSLVGPEGQVDPNSTYQWQDIPASYNHAITAPMLSEAYGMRDVRDNDGMRQAIESSLRLSLRVQRSPKRDIDRGGWRYFSRYDAADSDLSITGWYLMSLRSARNAGFDVPKEPIDQAMAYVTRCFSDREQTFTYTMPTPRRPLSRAMAAAGILALAHGGQHNSTQARAAGDWLLRNPFRAYNRLDFEKDSYHYGMFYTCQAMYQLGGDYWRRYFPAAAEQLIDSQQLDGSWEPDSNGNEIAYGQCYTTALGVLALSAANQLLPIFQR
jgi:hypothetical protein